jgi:LysM repeat protein
MTPLVRCTIVIALCICLAPQAWGQQYLLYTPQPVPDGQRTTAQDGILVREIEIQNGDTLYTLSRKFSGHGMYFPQILLFNSIKNPNLIYAGNTLRIPVTHNDASGSGRTDAKPAGGTSKPHASGDKKTSAKTGKRPPIRHSTAPSPVSGPSTELSLSDLKAGGTGKSRVSRIKKRTTVPASSDSAAGQKLFEAAVKAFRQDDCRTALELLDRYLADNSGSPLAADANLYKAECFLKLSAQ